MKQSHSLTGQFQASHCTLVKPSLELEPSFTGTWRGSPLDALCNESVWRSHDDEADDDNHGDDDNHDEDDDDDDDGVDNDDHKVAMIMKTMIIWRVWV